MADEEGEGGTLYATVEKSVTYPVVLVMVNGVKCRALVNTGAESCYASSALIERFSIKLNLPQVYFQTTPNE